jgi:SAM-dependent methyltransferase
MIGKELQNVIPDPLPSGESFDAWRLRNLEWWRSTRDVEFARRLPFYRLFFYTLRSECAAGGLSSSWRRVLWDKSLTIAEFGPGAWGGMVNSLKIECGLKVMCDLLIYDLVKLQFVDWDEGNTIFVEAPFEKSPLENISADIGLSFNALDHGWDIRASLKEIARVCRRSILSFDCKVGIACPEDDLDHYQRISFADLNDWGRREFGENWRVYIDLRKHDIHKVLHQEFPCAFVLLGEV